MKYTEIWNDENNVKKLSVAEITGINFIAFWFINLLHFCSLFFLLLAIYFSPIDKAILQLLIDLSDGTLAKIFLYWLSDFLI